MRDPVSTKAYHPQRMQPRTLMAPAHPMDAPCTCGRRYGMHRVNDYACPNPGWKPGNGQEQWMADQTFERAHA